LGLIDPSAYARTRNFLDGAVSRLSPYLRHGVLGLGEVRDAAVARRSRATAYKFVSELGWRDYYRRVHAALGDGVWNDLEPYKTGERAQSYGAEVPADVLRAETGAACIDSFTGELLETGYLHNHARMWFASYLTHWRRVRWQAGAAWFLRNLIDGDPASNNLSWQWVASTFGAKPYVFNRANLERYTRGAYCSRCPLATGGGCPFEGSYERLDAKLFPNGRRVVAEATNAARAELHVSADPPANTPPPPAKAVVWQHEESLAASDAARSLVPGAPAIFVWDAEARRRDPWPAIRRRFVEESLEELSLSRVASGDAAREIAAFARANEANTIVATAPVDPRLRAIAAELRAGFAVTLVEPPRFATLDRPVDLQRHARYWSRAQHTAFGPATRSVAELELGIEST
jgi:deoxyribodipyrimidine photo-lyase